MKFLFFAIFSTITLISESLDTKHNKYSNKKSHQSLRYIQHNPRYVLQDIGEITSWFETIYYLNPDCQTVNYYTADSFGLCSPIAIGGAYKYLNATIINNTLSYEFAFYDDNECNTFEGFVIENVTINQCIESANGTSMKHSYQETPNIPSTPWKNALQTM
jgi:hypothetical protein